MSRHCHSSVGMHPLSDYVQIQSLFHISFVFDHSTRDCESIRSMPLGRPGSPLPLRHTTLEFGESTTSPQSLGRVSTHGSQDMATICLCEGGSRPGLHDIKTYILSLCSPIIHPDNAKNFHSQGHCLTYATPKPS